MLLASLAEFSESISPLVNFVVLSRSVPELGPNSNEVYVLHVKAEVPVLRTSASLLLGGL